MTFQRKLLLSFCIMVVPVVLVGIEAVRSNREERQALRALGESMARTRKYADLETSLFRQSRQVWTFLAGIERQAKAEFYRLEPEIQEQLRVWESELEPDERDLTRDIERIHAEIFAVGERVFSLSERGNGKAARDVAERELNGRLLPALSAKNKEVYGAARKHSLQRAYARLEEILRAEQRALLSIIALALGVALVASIFISRGLARPVRELKAAMEVIGQGHLDHPIPVRSKDEIGELAQAFARMTENLKRSHEAQARLNLELEAQIKKLEETQAQLIQSEKLASIGEMAAAVAHGLRNPLSSLRTAAQVALRRVREEPVAQDSLKTVIAEVDRLDRRINHLLSFSRPAPFRPMPEQLARLVQGLLPTFAGQLRDRGIVLKTDLPSDLPEVQVDPIQVEQALGEIISNALEAMPNGGRLTIRGAHHQEQAAAEAVVIEITDTGEGIPEQVLPSLCTPFFTTKADGTGLGLAIAKRYVTQNGGRLEITSAQGGGTTVRIFLPAVRGTADPVRAAVSRGRTA